MLENIGSDVKLIAEGHGGIIRQMDNIESELNIVKSAVMESSSDIKELKFDVERLKFGQETIKQKLDTVTSNHEQRLQRLEAKIN